MTSDDQTSPNFSSGLNQDDFINFPIHFGATGIFMETFGVAIMSIFAPTSTSVLLRAQFVPSEACTGKKLKYAHSQHAINYSLKVRKRADK